MKKIESVNRSKTLLISLSIVYALLNMQPVMLAPIVTIVMPYRFMKTNDNVAENRRTFINLLVFNMLAFIIVSSINNNINHIIFEIVSNILMVLVYFMILSRSEIKTERIINQNPEMLYNDIIKRIESLENMNKQMEIDIENSQDEKAKRFIKIKKANLEINIKQLKDQAENIKIVIEKKNTQGM